jgi:RNA polymerase sigma-70 factor (ECF subfamily)
MQSAIDRFNAGDAEALNDLLARAAQRLMDRAHDLLVNDRVHDHVETGDLAHETWIRLRHAFLREVEPTRIRTPHDFFHLSGTVMRRALIDFARKLVPRQGRAANQAKVPLGGSSSAPGVTPVDRANGPAEQAESRELYARVYEHIEALPPNLRDVIDVVKFGGCTQEEAAQVLHVSVPTIKRWLRKAMEALMEEMDDLGEHLPGAL